MSGIVRSRVASLIFKNHLRCFSTSTINSHTASASRLSGQSPPSSPPPPPPFTSSPQPPTPTPNVKKSRGFLKFGIFAAFIGATATAGYATYAYTLDEVDQMTKAYRQPPSPKHTLGDDASALDKFQALVYSSAMKVPAKAIELYLELRQLVEQNVREFTEPLSDKLLPDLHPLEQHVYTLVLDLSETLIYSDWKRERGWRTFKRPGVDDFLERLSQFYEIVLYTDQMPMYVEPVIERLDHKQCIRYRLSRPATRYQDGKHYRDLSKLNRDPAKILYVSGHAHENTLQPENGVRIKPWKLEEDDTSLLDLMPFLEYVARYRPADIRPVLASYKGGDIGKEFIERNKDFVRKTQDKDQRGLFWRR